jgi:hypothetical protein
MTPKVLLRRMLHSANGEWVLRMPDLRRSTAYAACNSQALQPYVAFVALARLRSAREKDDGRLPIHHFICMIFSSNTRQIGVSLLDRVVNLREVSRDDRSA